MPWSPKQHRLFAGVAHGNIAPKPGLTKTKAAKMAKEGVRKPSPRSGGHVGLKGLGKKSY